jgi:hypothetical protein
MDAQVQLPFIFDVEKDLPMRVTLYPTGHLAIGLEEFMKEYGHAAIPPDLQAEVQAFLKKEYSGKELTEDDGKRISEEIACIARAHMNKKKPRGKKKV